MGAHVPSSLKANMRILYQDDPNAAPNMKFYNFRHFCSNYLYMNLLLLCEFLLLIKEEEGQRPKKDIETLPPSH